MKCQPATAVSAGVLQTIPWLNDIYYWRLDDGCLNSLLSLTSHSEEGGGEPRWQVFCDYLAKAMARGG